MDAKEARARADQYQEDRARKSEINLGELWEKIVYYADRGDYCCPLRIERPLKDGIIPPDGTWLSEVNKAHLIERGFRFTKGSWCEYGRLSSNAIWWDIKKPWYVRLWDALPF